MLLMSMHRRTDSLSGFTQFDDTMVVGRSGLSEWNARDDPDLNSPGARSPLK